MIDRAARSSARSPGKAAKTVGTSRACTSPGSIAEARVRSSRARAASAIRRVRSSIFRVPSSPEVAEDATRAPRRCIFCNRPGGACCRTCNIGHRHVASDATTRERLLHETQRPRQGPPSLRHDPRHRPRGHAGQRQRPRARDRADRREIHRTRSPGPKSGIEALKRAGVRSRRRIPHRWIPASSA